MRKIYKQLIISDFDGTLVRSDNTVSEKVKNAIDEYVSCGGIFAVSTGRMLRSILPRVRELGLKGLVAAYQGSVIAEIESGKLLRENCLTAEQSALICEFVERYGYTSNIYSNEILYTSVPADDIRIVTYEKVTGVKANTVNGSVAEFILKNSLACNKITFLVYPEERERLFSLLKEQFDSEFDVTCSSSRLVEMSPKGDDKGYALKFIANHFGIDLSSTVAIGDNLNDLSMIQAASIGVAVGNAVEGLKAQADYVSASNNDDAVAQIIEKYGFR